MTAARRDRIEIAVTIGAGASLSSEVFVDGLEIVGIRMPADWTAAAITLAGLLADGTFGPVYDDWGSEIVITADKGQYIAVQQSASLVGLGTIKVRSGTAALAVAQVGKRDLFFVCLT